MEAKQKPNWRHNIWSNYALDLDDWRDDILEEYPGSTEEELYDLMVEMNSRYLDDERMNLDKQLNTHILVIANLGLWYGRRDGYRIIESGNLKDCLSDSNCDLAEWYVDELGDLCFTGSHHDGVNYAIYRGVKPGTTEEQLNALCQKIYEGKANRKDITQYTYRLGDIIGDVYGWKVKGRRSKYA